MRKEDSYQMQENDFLYSGEENRYSQTRKEKASPYNLSYKAAWNLRPKYLDPYVPVQPKPVETKRTVILVVICILMVALITVLALSYFVVLPEYTALFQKVGQGEAGADKAIGLDDVINSVLRKLALGATDADPAELDFYTDCLLNVDSLEIEFMIAYYALPVSIVLTAVIALYVLFKGLSAAGARMKRRKFSYIILLQLLFSLLGVVSGFVWSKAAIGEIADYLLGSNTSFVLGIGYLVVIGIEFFALIFSFFAYKSKKQADAEAQAKADEINRRNMQAYYSNLPPNTIIGDL